MSALLPDFDLFASPFLFCLLGSWVQVSSGVALSFFSFLPPPHLLLAHSRRSLTDHVCAQPSRNDLKVKNTITQKIYTGNRPKKKTAQLIYIYIKSQAMQLWPFFQGTHNDQKKKMRRRWDRRRQGERGGTVCQRKKIDGKPLQSSATHAGAGWCSLN
ncbi:hypothetical protein BKA57DRAFT_209314 [Linnemannia elongata]|nr:hypothetical protein BKA57DRAFT_209314 [Linnemannia elongata]